MHVSPAKVSGFILPFPKIDYALSAEFVLIFCCVDGGMKIRKALAGPTGEQYKLPPDLGDNYESNSLSMAISGCVMRLRVPTSSYVSAFMCDGPAGRLLSDSNFRRAYDLVLIGTLHALGVF